MGHHVNNMLVLQEAAKKRREKRKSHEDESKQVCHVSPTHVLLSTCWPSPLHSPLSRSHTGSEKASESESENSKVSFCSYTKSEHSETAVHVMGQYAAKQSIVGPKEYSLLPL